MEFMEKESESHKGDESQLEEVGLGVAVSMRPVES